MPKLKTEIDTPEMQQRVIDAFAASVYAKVPDEETYCAVFEHGQWWITCDQTGAQWSVVDATGGASIDGFDFERVSEDDDGG